MKRLTLLMLVLLTLVVCGAAMAEDLTDRWGVGLTFGLMKPVGGMHDYAAVDPIYGVWGRKGLTDRWSLDLGLRMGKWHQGVEFPGGDADLTFDTFGNDYTKMWQAMMGARYNLNPESRFNPYFGMHVGFAKWRVVDDDGSNDLGFVLIDDDTVVGYNQNGDPSILDHTNLTGTLTLGMEYFFSESTSMDLGARFNFLASNDLDNIGTSAVWGPNHPDDNSGFWEAFAGLTWYWGGNKDKDKDGILNQDDACPDDPEDFDSYQDKDGCPDLDNDGDGLLDAEDKCPNEAEDFDGFQDADGCPDLDNDGDGVLDTADQCPGEAEDRDGYMDNDGCPDPDNDGDGVLDAADQCPDTPAGAAVDANGCPTAERRDLILKGVNFEFNSARLTAESSATLDEVVESLSAFDTITIEIAGHTDSLGDAAYNQQLSQARAETVFQYLAGKGIARDRMRAVGYGEDRPIDTNETEAGRAKNRRVELNRTDQ